jgi:hypothetical protein
MKSIFHFTCFCGAALALSTVSPNAMAFGPKPVQPSWQTQQGAFVSAGPSGTNVLLFTNASWSCTIFATQSNQSFDNQQEALNSAPDAQEPKDLFFLGQSQNGSTPVGQSYGDQNGEWYSYSAWTGQGIASPTIWNNYVRIIDSYHIIIERDYLAGSPDSQGAPTSVVDSGQQAAAYEACARPQP